MKAKVPPAKHNAGYKNQKQYKASWSPKLNTVVNNVHNCIVIKITKVCIYLHPNLHQVQTSPVCQALK